MRGTPQIKEPAAFWAAAEVAAGEAARRRRLTPPRPLRERMRTALIVALIASVLGPPWLLAMHKDHQQRRQAEIAQQAHLDERRRLADERMRERLGN